MIRESLPALAIILVICFGAFAVAPRSKAGLSGAVSIALLILLGLTLLGSALVGPVDLSPMLLFTPFTLFCAALWYLWKIKPREQGNG